MLREIFRPRAAPSHRKSDLKGVEMIIRLFWLAHRIGNKCHAKCVEL